MLLLSGTKNKLKLNVKSFVGLKNYLIFADVKNKDTMTDKEFKDSKKAILTYCERNDLHTEVSNKRHEVDFCGDFGMYATDRETLETPNCIYTKKYIVVYLPIVDKNNMANTINTYMNIAAGLVETAKPDYLMGVEKGVVKAVMYCVWD
jgi:hypothetical protein